MATTCGVCGRHVQEDSPCSACPVEGGCGLVRCPTCSYENPAWPGWMRALGRWLARWEGCEAVFQGTSPAPVSPILDDAGGPPGPRLRLLSPPLPGPTSRDENGKDAA